MSVLILKPTLQELGKDDVESSVVTVQTLMNLKKKSAVLLYFLSTLIIIHNSFVLIAVPGAKLTKPKEINRQRSPNSSSSPLELT